MALWQCTYYLLPMEGVETLSQGSIRSNLQLIFDDEEYWKFKLCSRELFSSINVFLPKQQSWSSDIDLYGSQDSNCVEVFCENNLAYSIRLRIDFLSNYEILLKELIEFCIRMNLIIIDETRNVLELNFSYISDNIYKSNQYKKYILFNSL